MLETSVVSFFSVLSRLVAESNEAIKIVSAFQTPSDDKWKDEIKYIGLKTEFNIQICLIIRARDKIQNWIDAQFKNHWWWGKNRERIVD